MDAFEAVERSTLTLTRATSHITVLSQGVGADALALGDDAPDAAAREKDAELSRDEAPKAGLRTMNAMAGAFAGESSTARDPDAEDPHMLQYVEAELAKRRQASGLSEPSGSAVAPSDAALAPPASASSLWETPAALASTPREEEESADRYLTGIVEVQLPAEVKFKNIEETERAKAELLKKQRRREFRGGSGGGGGASAAEGNFSSNFALHKKQHAAAQKRGARGGNGSTAMQPPPSRAHGEARPPKRDRAENVASDEYVFKRWMNNEKKRKH